MHTDTDAEQRVERTKSRMMGIAEAAQEMQKWELKQAQYRATILASLAWLLSLSAFVFTVPIIILAVKIGAMLWGM